VEVKDKVAELKGIPNLEDLVEQLQKGVLTVTFLKLDGDKRIMDCTKSFDVIPKEHQPKTDNSVLDEKASAEPTKVGLVTVWDINAKGWRSFKYDRVQVVELCQTSNN
jgi:hypothetical protein